MSSAETFLPLLPMLLCIRNRASIYCQFSYTHAPRQDAVSILKFQEGDGVCWVMGFRYSEVPLTFMGQGCMCTCVCMWTCVGPSMCVHMWAHVLDRGCVCVCVHVDLCWTEDHIHVKGAGNRHFVLRCVNFWQLLNGVSGEKEKEESTISISAQGWDPHV